MEKAAGDDGQLAQVSKPIARWNKGEYHAMAEKESVDLIINCLSSPISDVGHKVKARRFDITIDIITIVDI